MSTRKILAALSLSLPALPCLAQAAPSWGPHVDLELKPGSRRSLAESDIFLPLAQDGRNLFFANLRGRFDDGSSREGNLGLGVRRMQDNGWNIGGYAYFDRRRTGNGNFFNQVTVGGEALGRDWDLRANAYLPRGNRVKQVGPGTTVAGTTTAALAGNTVQVTTTAGMTSVTEERALRGFDAEVGWRVPVFDAESPRQLRVYLGAFRFGDGVSRLSGPRARAELEVADLGHLWRGGQLTVGAEIQNDQARGTHAFFSLRLRIPLGGSVSGTTLTTQARRMAAPIVRDVDIVTQSRTNTVVTGTNSVETASVLDSGQAITVLDSSTTTGAALPGAVAAAGANSLVILSGTFNTSGITTLQTGQTLMGAGTLTVRTPSGRTATLTTPRATITGAVAGNNPAVALANNATLTGLQVSNTATGGGTPNPFAVRANGVTGATVSNNILLGFGNNGGGTAQSLLITGASSNITVSGNTLTSTGTTGISVGLNVVNSTGILVLNNTMSAASNAPATQSRAIVVNNGSFAAGSAGNTILNGICSVALAGTGSIGLTSGGTCP